MSNAIAIGAFIGAIGASGGGGNQAHLQFFVPMTKSIVPLRGTLDSYTRAGTKLLPDHEGVYRDRASGEAGFEGARVVKNLIPSLAGLNLSTSGDGTASDDGGGVYTFGITSSGRAFINQNMASVMVSGNKYRVSWEQTINSGSIVDASFIINAATVSGTITFNETGVRGTGNLVTAGAGGFLRLGIGINTTPTTACNMTVSNIQIEDVTSALIQLPSEYINPDVDYGLNIVGAKSFTTENGNTVTDNVVTEATGTAIADSTLKGLDVREAKLNSLLRNKDYTDAAWAVAGAPTATPNYNQVDIEGVTNGACELTDDNASSFVSYTQTLAISNDGASHGRHVFVKQEDDETSFPEFQINVFGGTPQQIQTQLNRKTGAITNRSFIGVGGAYVTSIIINGELWWWLRQYIDNNTSGNTSLSYRDFPAVTTTFGVAEVGAQGTVIVDYPAVTLNSKTTGLPVETEGTAVLTVKDVAQYEPPAVLTGANVNNFIIPFEFTMPYDAAYIGASHYLFYVQASNSNLHARIGSDGRLFTQKRLNGVNHSALGNDALTGGVTYKMVARFSRTKGVHLFIAGLKQTIFSSNTDDIDMSITPTKFFVGSTTASIFQINSTVKMGKVISIDASDAYCEALTT